MDRPQLSATSITIMAPDPHELAGFYARLLGCDVADSDPEWAQVRTDLMTINVEHERVWREPVWPAEAGRQSSTQHLDIHVEDLAAAEAWAVECGAHRAEVQPQDDIRVMRDPAGHPFCLFL